MTNDANRIDLSVLIPVYNEVDNVGPLHAELDAVLRTGPWKYELIFVNDGSTDGTAARLGAIQRADPDHVRVAFLRRNCGQTAALSAALDLARGQILVPMDGDRQNDPADIPRLIAALDGDGGHDVVSGWRKDRHDAFLSRKVPSWIANRLVARISGVPLHDFGCTLKAYRRTVLEGVRLYGEMHRFIPIFAAWQGARVTELVVNHRPRTAGKTKYGLGRTFNVVLDLILIRFLQRYSQRPLHFFGRFGLWSFALSLLSFAGMLYFKYLFPWPHLWWPRDLPAKSFVETPLPSLTVMFFLGGFVSILLGIQSELIMRTYYESQHKTTYLLDEVRQGPMKEDRAMTTPARRQLKFASLDEVMPEVERLLAGHVTVGAWSLGQILDHLAFAIGRVATGPAASEPPTPEQQELQRRLFAGDRFPDGIELPSAFSPPPGADPAAAAEALRAAIAAFTARTAPFPAHPRLGPMTGEEWVKLHRMHCAHHLGFVVPTEDA